MRKSGGSSCELRTLACYLYQMQDFIKGLQQYFMAEVVQHNWDEMMRLIKDAKTFDEVYVAHNRFIDGTSQDCMLSDNRLASALNELLRDCSNDCTLFLVRVIHKFFIFSVLFSNQGKNIVFDK